MTLSVMTIPVMTMSVMTIPVRTIPAMTIPVRDSVGGRRRRRYADLIGEVSLT